MVGVFVFVGVSVGVDVFVGVGVTVGVVVMVGVGVAVGVSVGVYVGKAGSHVCVGVAVGMGVPFDKAYNLPSRETTRTVPSRPTATEEFMASSVT